MEAALEAGAEDIVVNDDTSVDVHTDPADYESVRDAMIAAGLPPGEAEVTMVASTQTELGEKQAGTMMTLLEVLEDLDDVQQVYSNAEIPDEILAQLADSA